MRAAPIFSIALSCLLALATVVTTTAAAAAAATAAGTATGSSSGGGSAVGGAPPVAAPGTCSSTSSESGVAPMHERSFVVSCQNFHKFMQGLCLLPAVEPSLALALLPGTATWKPTAHADDGAAGGDAASVPYCHW